MILVFPISSNRKLSIGFFGEAMVEFSGSPYQLSYGGDVLNTAIYLSRLVRISGDLKPAEQPLSIHFVSAVGNDSLSDSLIDKCSEEGVSTQYVMKKLNKKLGLYIVEKQCNGERIFHYWRNDSAIRSYFCDPLTPFEVALERNKFDVIYLSGTSLAVFCAEHRSRLIDRLTVFKARGGKIFFDNNYRGQLWRPEEARDWYSKILNITDIAFLTDDDEKQVFGSDDLKEIYDRSKHYGIPETIVKRGAKPCIVFSGKNKLMITAEVVENIEDTCAAGDSFAAGYLSKRLFGKTVNESAIQGHLLASKVLKIPGAIIPLEYM